MIQLNFFYSWFWDNGSSPFWGADYIAPFIDEKAPHLNKFSLTLSFFGL